MFNEYRNYPRRHRWNAFNGIELSIGVCRSAYASAPDIHFKRIDDSFHFVMLDQPERFSDTVESFLNGDASQMQPRTE